MGIWEKSLSHLPYHRETFTHTATSKCPDMFLAEDRILCFELVAKANEKWVSPGDWLLRFSATHRGVEQVLGYVRPALGETFVHLLEQRSLVAIANPA